MSRLSKVGAGSFAVVAALSLPAGLASPGISAPPPARAVEGPLQASKPYIAAVIIPTQTYSVGSSLPSGPLGKSFGYALMANGIDDSYQVATAPKTTAEFVFFVYTNDSSQRYTISFSVVSPTNSTIYSYKFQPKLVQQTGAWFTVGATGNFEAAGTYFAEVHAGGSLIGWIPLNYVAS